MKQPRLTNLARIAIEDLPDQTRVSLPFIFRSGEVFRIGFLVYPAVPRFREPSIVCPPSHVVVIEAEGLSPIEKLMVQPEQLLEGHAAGNEIGRYGIPEDMTADQFTEESLKMDDIATRLCRGLNLGENTDALRGEYIAIFKKLCEDPLKPYYKKFGGAFFNGILE